MYPSSAVYWSKVEEGVAEARAPPRAAHVAQDGGRRGAVPRRQRARLRVALHGEAPLPQQRVAPERPGADEEQPAHAQLVHPLKFA